MRKCLRERDIILRNTGIKVGIYSPGDMGSAVGACIAQAQGTPYAVLDQRSQRTRQLASAAGIQSLPTDLMLVQEVEMILSIMPPAKALQEAQRLSGVMQKAQRFPLFVDCNAISATTTQRIGKVIEATGGRFVDASIVGPPPRRQGVTRFYASGELASTFADMLGRTLDIRVLSGGIGAASHMKSCYASITKGFTALGGIAYTAAEQFSVYEALMAELQFSQPDLARWLEGALSRMAPKAWRWIAEMQEHGDAFATAQLSPAMMQGAADFYAFVAKTPPGNTTPEDPPLTPQALVEALAKGLDGIKPQP